jgi:hypothetical protein
LLITADSEIQIEKVRQALAKLVEFEPYAAFTRIDRENKGYVTGRDISVFIK